MTTAATSGSSKVRTAVVIPAYNEQMTIRGVALRVLRTCDQVYVVDDGSTDDTAQCVGDLPLHLLRNDRNKGKAASLWRGMQAALADGAEAILTLDGDGQHQPEDIPRFVTAARRHPEAIIVGSRLGDRAAVPPSRYRANRIANFWISWVAGHAIEDSQSGFRLYPADLLRRIDIPTGRGRGFVFESEVLIEAARLGYRFRSVPIAAVYAEDARPSHFRPVLDVARITRMVAWRLLSTGLNPGGLYHCVLGPRVQRLGSGAIGGDGLAMLLVSTLIIAVSGGLPLLWLFVHALGVARRSGCEMRGLRSAIVLGKRLSGGRVCGDYRARLDRAGLFLAHDASAHLMLLGGMTGGGDISEAEAGRRYLIERGCDGRRIAVEAHSRHTLENLRKARAWLPGKEAFALITSRYHLARSEALARGLGMHPVLCPAEADFAMNPRAVLRLAGEAFLLHWYHTGRLWSHLTRNRRMLERIT